MVSAWTRLRAAADPVTRRFGWYAAYPLTEREFIGTLDISIAATRYWLRQNAYEPQYLSAAKRHPMTNQLHDLSYRRVSSQSPPEVNGTALDWWPPSACQYHVHAFERGEREVEVYSHYELRPDLLHPQFDPKRLRIHYRPEYGEEYLRGVTDLSI